MSPWQALKADVEVGAEVVAAADTVTSRFPVSLVSETDSEGRTMGPTKLAIAA